jgi:hypothetical protein
MGTHLMESILEALSALNTLKQVILSKHFVACHFPVSLSRVDLSKLCLGGIFAITEKRRAKVQFLPILGVKM